MGVRKPAFVVFNGLLRLEAPPDFYHGTSVSNIDRSYVTGERAQVIRHNRLYRNIKFTGYMGHRRALVTEVQPISNHECTQKELRRYTY